MLNKTLTVTDIATRTGGQRQIEYTDFHHRKQFVSASSYINVASHRSFGSVAQLHERLTELGMGYEKMPLGLLATHT
jgi:hypothetical protein